MVVRATELWLAKRREYNVSAYTTQNRLLTKSPCTKFVFWLFLHCRGIYIRMECMLGTPQTNLFAFKGQRDLALIFCRAPAVS